MDWHSLAVKSTELSRAGLGCGETAASSERMKDRMLRTQARQPSRKASSTAGVSVKRLKEDADEFSAEPEELSVDGMESAQHRNGKQTSITAWPVLFGHSLCTITKLHLLLCSELSANVSIRSRYEDILQNVDVQS